MEVYTLTITKIIKLVHLPIFQKSNFKSQTLNKSNLFSKYLNFNLILEFMGHKFMCDNNVYYFRLTNPKIIPTYLYWHIVQDFALDNVKRLGGRDYIGLRNLSKHIIYISGKSTTLLNLGQFVNNERYANLSIGRYPHNFGEVKLLNNNFIYLERKQR